MTLTEEIILSIKHTVEQIMRIGIEMEIKSGLGVFYIYQDISTISD